MWIICEPLGILEYSFMEIKTFRPVEKTRAINLFYHIVALNSFM